VGFEFAGRAHRREFTPNLEIKRKENIVKEKEDRKRRIAIKKPGLGMREESLMTKCGGGPPTRLARILDKDRAAPVAYRKSPLGAK
jgi:hypothetical protein